MERLLTKHFSEYSDEKFLGLDRWGETAIMNLRTRMLPVMAGILSLSVSQSVQAGGMYDMRQMLSEPHPFATSQVTVPASPAMSQPQIPSEQVPSDSYPSPRILSESSEEAPGDWDGVWRFELQNEEMISWNIFEWPMQYRFSERVESGHLTWGWRLSYTPNEPNPDWFDKNRDEWFWLWPADKWKVRANYALQQSAYTQNTFSKDHNLADRPDAGYLLGNVRLNLEQDFVGNRQYIDHLNLGLGIVGPASGADVTHRVVHSAIGRSSRGWDEIKSEPVFFAHYESGKRWVWGEDSLNAEIYPHSGLSLGNAFTYAALGFSARVGSHLKKDSGPLRTRMIMSGPNYPQAGDYFAWNLFAGIEGRAVAYNIFVDGNTYSDTSDVSSKPLVADVQLGGEIGMGQTRFSMMHVFRSREFKGQIKADQFLRFGLSSDLNGWDRGSGKSGSARQEGPLWGTISELRLGMLSHDAKFPSRHGIDAPNPFENRYESGININPEVVFISPDMLDVIGAPRPHVGISANVGDDTNSAYTGLGWDAIWDTGVFLEGFLGMAVHDGKLRDGNPDKVEFGSKALARLGGELGWRWDKANGISFIWEHMSNAGVLSDKNQGIDSLGLRYSYRFDG